MTGDGLPELLCLICESKLNTAFEFKLQCEQSDVALRQLAINQKRLVKEEVVVRVDPDFANVFNDDDGHVRDTER